AIDTNRAGAEVGIKPHRNVAIGPVLCDPAVFSRSEVSDRLLASQDVLPLLEPTRCAAPDDEKVECFAVACGMAANRRNCRRGYDLDLATVTIAWLRRERATHHQQARWQVPA